MKRTINSLIIIILFIVAVSWSGCKDDNGPEVEEFIIQIDSMIHADTISLGNDLEIKLYGLIGPNGCYEFDRFVPEFVTGKLTVTSWGKHTIQDMCTEEIVYMTGKKLFVSDLPAGSSTVTAIQPDGTELSQEVYVRE